MSIRKIATDETFSGSTTVQPGNKIVAVKFSARKSETSDRYELNCKLNFTDCSATDILELATRTCVIDLQRQWRIAANVPNSAATKTNPFETVNVKTAIVENARTTGTPMQRAISALGKLTAKERAAIIAEMLKDLPAETKKTA